MMKEKLVFVTNDDGYNSRGIQALLEVARKFGRVVAIAPETPQSGMSQAITINNPLFLREVSKGDGVEVYAFSGTPVDCVKIGCWSVLPAHGGGIRDSCNAGAS